jgi:hypothetical protein
VAYTQFSLFLVIFGMMLMEHVIACGWPLGPWQNIQR